MHPYTLSPHPRPWSGLVHYEQTVGAEHVATALDSGVNLPAYLCVIRGTRQYAGGGQYKVGAG